MGREHITPPAHEDDNLAVWIGGRVASTVERLDPLLGADYQLELSDGERLRRVGRAVGTLVERNAYIETRVDPGARQTGDWERLWYDLRDLAAGAARALS